MLPIVQHKATGNNSIHFFQELNRWLYDISHFNKTSWKIWAFPIWVTVSHRIREPAGLRGRIAGLVGGEWCSCWAQLCDSSPVCQRQPNERHMASSMVCSASTTHSMWIHSQLLFYTAHYKTNQVTHCKQTYTSFVMWWSRTVWVHQLSSDLSATCLMGRETLNHKMQPKIEISLFVSCCNCVERSDDHISDI